MAIMAPKPDQAFMGMSMSHPLSYPADDLGSVLEAPSGLGAGGAAGVPGFGRYWARSSWSSCVVDNSHLGLVPSTMGMAPTFGSSPSASFGAGRSMGPYSVGKSSVREPASGGASARAPVQPLLEAVEGVTEASAMVEAAAAAAATHGHGEVTQQQQQQENVANTSSCSEHHPGGGRGAGGSPGVPHSPATSPSHDSLPAGCRKRKKELSPPDPKGGEAKRGKEERSSSEASTESGSPKEAAGGRDGKGKAVQSGGGKPKEYSKQDYIHVRARRGQATDSHSLAERVRREKISERMKYLQDLVPGCKKVTGKAVMLDEIINYVQSLQRQVEHLSMKLASVNPGHPEGLALESLVSNKEVLQTHLASILGGNAAEAPGALDVVQMGLSHQAAGRRLVGGGPCGFDLRALGNAGLDLFGPRHTMSPAIAGGLPDHMAMVQRSFDNNVSQSTGWDGELQSVVQMGLNHQGRLGAFEGLHCQLPVGHMKVEF